MDSCFDYNTCVLEYEGDPCGAFVDEECTDMGSVICSLWNPSAPPLCQENGSMQCQFDGGDGLPN
jgi:hypothetical protein